MNKKLFAFIFLFCSLALFVACGDDDDDNSGIDQEWKSYNEKQISEVSVAGSGYQSITSQSKNGAVYYKKINYFEEIDAKSTPSTKITEAGTPYYTDSIAMRYEGYFFEKDGRKIIFERDNNNGVVTRARVSSNFVDGFSTMLQNMKKGDQVEVVIPQQLGYGVNALKDAAGNIKIPAYTTIRFKLYLVDIYPDNPGEFD
ncbi:FKBP-type peptidyl-prolyl cis-trans isomerase [Prevotella sp. 10(H)]|uniref:FKBP-type peptidyl-prolyl cis-trans isomerase n=1 Tax=Prevotella sp. 10(H) TaxID=1158294 RepID=UPI00055AA925|nr:FKBP-type peptidyl-prolyl cis-trans isomerase [Prevotella sp. 10(H)]